MKILLKTKRGIRTAEIKDLSKYGKTTYKGQAAYSRKYKILTPKGIRNRIVADRSKLIYNPNAQAYETFNAKKTMEVQTEQGVEKLTHEQIKYLYERKGKTYRQKAETGRYVSPEKVKRKVPPMTQIEASIKVKIKGKVHIVQGYSKVQSRMQPYTQAQMIKAAREHMYAKVMALNREAGEGYNLNGVKMLSKPRIAMVRWVNRAKK